MMRFRFAVLAAMGVGLSCGCRPKSEGAPPLLAHYHFVGLSRLSANTNAAKLKALWNLPATRKLADQTLDRLARAPEAWWTPPNAPANPAATTLVRPLLNDLLEAESYGQWHGQPERLLEWTVALRLTPERARLWETNWSKFAAVCHLGAPAATKVEGYPALEFSLPGASARFRIVRAGAWTVVGSGTDGLAGQADLVARIKANRPLGVNLGDYWLEAGGELAGLRQWMAAPPGFRWPAARLTYWSQDNDLRARLVLLYPEPVAWSTAPWEIPVQTIRPPLISFTAMRGIAPWLRQLDCVRSAALSSVPDEAFLWAQQSQIPVQTFFAMPMPKATNAMETIAQQLRDRLAPELIRHRMGQIRWDTNHTELNWVGLPFVVPNLRAVREPAGDFLVGGLFASLPSTNPPPPELIAQVAGRTNLLYYDWEITEARLIHWRALTQLYAIISSAWHAGDATASGHPAPAPTPDAILDTNTPTQLWLQAVAPFLGNTITRGSVTSPRELTFERKSPLSLTGFELVMLTRLLENPAFLAFGRPQAASPTSPAAPAPAPRGPPAP